MAATELPDTAISLKAVQAVVDQIAQPLFILDMGALSIVSFNQAACDLYRYTPRDLLGRSILELRPASEVERTIRRAQATKNLSTPTDLGVFIHRTKDGVNFPVSVYAGPIAPGTNVALVTDLRDSDPEQQHPGAERLIPVPELSPREREVARQLVLGRTSREIAGSLAISRRTVEAHVDNILAKLGARNRAHAVALVLSNGLLLRDHRN